MLAGYEYMADRLGPAGAPQHAAHEMLELLKNNFLFLNKRKAGAVNARLFYLYSRRIKKRGTDMKNLIGFSNVIARIGTRTAIM